MSYGKLSRLVPLVLICLSVGACAGGTSGPPTVGLAITAPTDGSTVGVRTLELIGHVTPANAVVVVGRRVVRVQKGTFRQPLTLLHRLTHISVVAQASGFRGVSTVIAVRYSPRLLHDPRAAASHARAAGNSSGPPRASTSSGPPRVHVPSLASTLAGESADANQLIRPEFIAHCTNLTPSRLSYCTCVWNRLKAAGLDTPAKFTALAEEWRRTFLARGVIVYPAGLKNAILSCRGQLPTP